MAAIFQATFWSAFFEWLSFRISPNFVPNGSITNIPVLVQIMAWRRWGNKPLSVPIIVSLQTYICFTRPQRVDGYDAGPSITKAIRKCWKEFTVMKHHAIYQVCFFFKGEHSQHWDKDLLCDVCCFQCTVFFKKWPSFKALLCIKGKFLITSCPEN